MNALASSARVIDEFKIPRSEELTQRLEEAGVNLLSYNPRWGRYRLQVDHEDLVTHAELLKELIAHARASYGMV